MYFVGYEHLVEFQEPDQDYDASQNERTDTALSGSDDSVSSVIRIKKKTKKHVIRSDSELDPLNDNFVIIEKKEHSESIERKKHRKKKIHIDKFDPLHVEVNEQTNVKHKKEKKDKRVKRKEKVNLNVSSQIFATEIPFVDSHKSASVTDSDYDSQGKSSLHSHSEGNEELMHDGLYSIDEMISSSNIQEQSVNLINNKMLATKGKASIEKCVYNHSQNLPDINTASSISEPMYKSVSEKVKRSLSRLLGERNNSPKVTPPIYKMPIAITRSNITIPTQINPKGITIPEMDIPQSYIEKKFDTGYLNPIIIHEPSVLKEVSTKKMSTDKPVIIRDLSTQEQRPKSYSKNACQNDFKNFLQNYTPPQNAGVVSEPHLRKHKDEIRGTVPVIQNLNTEIKTSQSAKLAPHKKDSLNTFSRLSYMHRNKIDKKQSIQSLLKQKDYIEPTSRNELKLNHLLTENKQENFKYLYPNLEIAKVDSNKIHPDANALEVKIPILRSMLQSAPIEKHKKNSDLRIPINAMNSSVLTVKDQNDLVHLIKQKNKQNTSFFQNNQVCNPFHKSERESDICKPRISPTNLKITNARLLNVSVPLQTTNNRNLIDTQPNCSNHSLHSNIESGYCSSSKVTKSNIRVKDTRIMEDKKPQTDWEEVMNNLLAHKTPSRGPNALDLALNKTRKTCENLRNQRIKKISTNLVKANTSEECLKISTDLKKVEYNPTPVGSIVTNINHNSATKSNTNLPHQDVMVNHLTLHNSILPTATCKLVTVPKIVNKSKTYNNIQTEFSKEQNIIKSKKPNHVETHRLSNEIQKRQFTCNLPKQDDPFISGLPNSDYDLIEELMDDELRKEIGELSDDDFNMTASGISKDIKSSTIYNNLQINRSAVIHPPKRDLKSEYEKKNQRHRVAASLKPEKTLGILETQIKKANNVHQTAQGIVENKNKLRPGVMQSLPENIIDKKSLEKDCTAVTEMNKNILNVPESSVYVIPPPTMSNVILVGRNIYNTYSTMPVELPMSNLSSNLYLNQSNLSMYHSTQYVAPVMSSVIIGSARTVLTPNLHEIPTAVPEAGGQLSDIVNTVKPLLIKTEEKKCSITDEASVVKCSKIDGVSTASTMQSDKAILDLKLNKNPERKVLSQVQKKDEKNDLITSKNQRCSIETCLKNEDKERLSKKRMSIISKMIYHGHNNEPIPLTYTPLITKSVYMDKNVKSNNKDNKKIGDNLNSTVSPKSEAKEINNFLTDDVSNSDAPDTRENSKENKITAPCRRILLRSLNKIVDVPSATLSNETTGRKVKVRLKENFTKKKDVANVSTEKAAYKSVIKTKCHSIKRLNKTSTNSKVSKTDLKKKTYSNEESKWKHKIKVAKRQLNNKVDLNVPLKWKKDVIESVGTLPVKNQITNQGNKIFDKPDLVETVYKMPTSQMHSNVEDIKSDDTDKKIEKIVIRKVNANKHEIATMSISGSLDITETKINGEACKIPSKAKPVLLPKTKSIELEKALTKIKHLLKPPMAPLTSVKEIKVNVVDKTADQIMPKLSQPRNVNYTNTCKITNKEVINTADIKTNALFETDINRTKESSHLQNAGVSTKSENAASEPIKTNSADKQSLFVDSMKCQDSNLPKIHSVNVTTPDGKNFIQFGSTSSDTFPVTKKFDISHEIPTDFITSNEDFSSTSAELLFKPNQESQNSTAIDNKDINKTIDYVKTTISRNGETLEPEAINMKNVNISTPINMTNFRKPIVAQTADNVEREVTKNIINCSDNPKNPLIISNQCPEKGSIINIKETVNPENVHSIVNSSEGEIVIEHLPSPEGDSNKQFVRIKLPNKKTYKATIYGKHVDINTIFSDPTFKSRLLKNSTNCLELILNYTRKGISQPIETVNLLSDEEDDVSVLSGKDEVSGYSFSTEFGKYKVRQIKKEEFTKHQKRFNQRSFVTLKRFVQEKPTDTVELRNKTSLSDFNEVLKCDEVISPIDNYNQENISIQQDNIKDVNTDIILIDDSSNDSVILVPPLPEDINTLKDLLCKELCLDATLTPNTVKNVTIVETPLEAVKCRECFILLRRCDNLVKKYEQNKILSKKCVVELERCDKNSVSIEVDILHNLSNSFDKSESESSSVLSRSGSLSILNDFALYCGDDVKNPNLELDRSSPVMEIYEMMTTFCTPKEINRQKIGNTVSDTIFCDSELFETKGKLRKHCMLRMSNYCIGLRERYNDSQSNTSISTPKVFKVPSLSAIIVSFFQSNDVVHKYRSSIISDQYTFHRHTPRLKRKYTGDRSSPTIKLAKTSVSPLGNRSNSLAIIKKLEEKLEEPGNLQNNDLVVLNSSKKNSDEINVQVEQSISIINNYESKQNNTLFHCYHSNTEYVKAVNKPLNTLNYVKDTNNDFDGTDDTNLLNMYYPPVLSVKSTKVYNNTFEKVYSNISKSVRDLLTTSSDHFVATENFFNKDEINHQIGCLSDYNSTITVKNQAEVSKNADQLQLVSHEVGESSNRDCNSMMNTESIVNIFTGHKPDLTSISLDCQISEKSIKLKDSIMVNNYNDNLITFKNEENCTDLFIDKSKFAINNVYNKIDGKNTNMEKICEKSSKLVHCDEKFITRNIEEEKIIITNTELKEFDVNLENEVISNNGNAPKILSNDISKEELKSKVNITCKNCYNDTRETDVMDQTAEKLQRTLNNDSDSEKLLEQECKVNMCYSETNKIMENQNRSEQLTINSDFTCNQLKPQFKSNTCVQEQDLIICENTEVTLENNLDALSTTLHTKMPILITEDIHKEEATQILNEVNMTPMSENFNNISKKQIKSYNTKIATLSSKSPILGSENIHKERREIVREVEMKVISESIDSASKKLSNNSESVTFCNKSSILVPGDKNKLKTSQVLNDVDTKFKFKSITKKPIEPYKSESPKSPIIVTDYIHDKILPFNEVNMKPISECINNASEKLAEVTTLVNATPVFIPEEPKQRTNEILNEVYIKSSPGSVEKSSKIAIDSYNDITTLATKSPMLVTEEIHEEKTQVFKENMNHEFKGIHDVSEKSCGNSELNAIAVNSKILVSEHIYKEKNHLLNEVIMKCIFENSEDASKNPIEYRKEITTLGTKSTFNLVVAKDIENQISQIKSEVEMKSKLEESNDTSKKTVESKNNEICVLAINSPISATEDKHEQKIRLNLNDGDLRYTSQNDDNFSKKLPDNSESITLPKSLLVLVTEDIHERSSNQILNELDMKSTSKSIGNNSKNHIESYTSVISHKSDDNINRTDCRDLKLQTNQNANTDISEIQVIQTNSNNLDHEYERCDATDNQLNKDYKYQQNISEAEMSKSIEEVNGIIYGVDEDISDVNETIVFMSSCEIIDDSACELRTSSVLSCNTNFENIHHKTHSSNFIKVSDQVINNSKIINGINCLKNEKNQVKSHLNRDISFTNGNYDNDMKRDTILTSLVKFEALRNIHGEHLDTNERSCHVSNQCNRKIIKNISNTNLESTQEINTVMQPLEKLELHDTNYSEIRETVENYDNQITIAGDESALLLPIFNHINPGINPTQVVNTSSYRKINLETDSVIEYDYVISEKQKAETISFNERILNIDSLENNKSDCDVEISNAHICKIQDKDALEVSPLQEHTTEQKTIVAARDFTSNYPNEFTLHNERELQGVEYHDPELGTYYVFNVVETISSDDASSDVSKSPVTVTGDEVYSELVSDSHCKCEFKPKVTSPLITYSRKAPEPPMQVNCNTYKKCKRPLKRKANSIDTRVEKKYRKGKNIDYPKFTAAAISESAYGKEYKQLTDYWKSIKFSYSRSFHREYVDIPAILNNWPINGSININVTDIEPDDTLFIDLEDICNPKIVVDPTLLPLAEEIETECKEVILPFRGIKETNFNMGFGEGSDRVIQNLEDGGDVSKSSAAILSDVKQNQPCLQSENYVQNNHSTSRNDQRNVIKKCFNYIILKEKVKAFFQKTSYDLNSIWMSENKKMNYNCTSHMCNFPFDLYSTEFFEAPQNETIVNVVQVGQLPVSAAAQNPVTCDPRVTQVSDASPSQCSAENTSSDDPLSVIKTEYTELTTADISLPLQDYSQEDRSTILETQEACNPQISDENIPIETEIKSIVKIELVEELPEEKEDETPENSESLLENQSISNVDYTFDSNGVNTVSDNSNFHMIFNPGEKQNMSENISSQNQQNGSLEKSDQIAHAMNAAGITTTQDTLGNARAQALVNILSQKIRQGTINVATSHASSNTFPKTSINAVALQQALAQILPTSLNQTNTETNQPNTPVTPQVLHIVQGKNASGNQITLVENTQQTVVSTSNSTPVLHIVQNKSTLSGPTSATAPSAQTNTFSSLSLVDTGIQQGGNQLLHIVNTGNQKTSNTGQLIKRVNLLTNLTNVQGSNEQKMVQFVCKSTDVKAIQLNAPNQRSMVLRLQPIETPNVQSNTQKSIETQDHSPNPAATATGKEAAATQQEIKSRSIYEENYAKFIQNSSTKPVAPEKATSLPKFNQAFGKQVFQDGPQKNENNNGNTHIPISTANSENPDSQQTDNAISLDQISQINSPPLLLRKTSVPTSQAQANLVQQIKQTIAPMNIQTMHGGVIYTRQIPVNIGGGQTINLITVPSTELIDENVQKQSDVKFVNQNDMESSIIKIVPQTQAVPNGEVTQEDSGTQLVVSSENAQTPQPVLTQMRIKLPMLSKPQQMVSGARVVRPSFFQIQRNVIGGANHPLYQQLVLAAAPQLGQQTIRLPQTQTRNNIKVSSETQSSTESQMSSSTLEQLREFDLVLEQVKERSTVQPNSNANTSFPKLHTPSTDSTDGSASVSSTSTDSTQQVLYSIGNNQPMNVAYVNRKATITTPTTTTFVRSPDSSGIADSPSSSSQMQLPHTVTTESTSNDAPAQTKPHKASSKSKSRTKSSSNPPNTLKLNTVPPKTSTQKPLEDEQTTQRILYILAEYKEQVENSPDKDKPAPRRRSNPPSNSSGSSKRKKSSSGSRRPGGRDMSPVQGDDACRTMGSEDSSCGTSQGDCNETCMESHSPQDSPRKVVRKLTFENETMVSQPRPQPQRNVIVADGQTITVARGTAGKPTTAVLMPTNYLLPVSMMKGGGQIAIVTNRGPKLLAVGGGEGGATNALLLQRLIGPAGLKPVLARPGVRHVRLPAAALHNLQAFNLTTATTVQPPDSTASPAPAPTPPELVETGAVSSPWTDRESQDVKPERGSSPEGSEPWNLPSSADPHDYTYEETVRTDSMDRTVLVSIKYVSVVLI